MDQPDLDLRNATYRALIEFGRAPTLAEIATATGLHESSVAEGWRRLHDAHALVLAADGSIAMLNPFAARPTRFRVEAGGRSWYANCGWDSFGIGAALGVDSVIHTACPDCDDPITIRVRDGQPVETDAVWHVLVPAITWWSDIGFT